MGAKASRVEDGSFDFVTPEGVKLVVDAVGNPADQPVLLLHGGGQTRHTWRSTAALLADAGYYAVAYDSRGHGDSDWVEAGDYSFEAYARDLRAISAALAPRPALIGASLGGLTSLVACGTDPKLDARAIVLVDVTPVPDPVGVARIRAFMQGHPDGFETVEQAADAVAAYLSHRPRPKSHAGLERNLRRRPDGRFRWHWDPRLLSDDKMNDQTRHRLEDAARALTAPTLLVRGADSDVVTDAQVAAFKALVPSSEYVSVSDAQHMIVGDNNEMANSVLLDFLRRALAR